MSKKLPISVHILTYNSASTLEKALQSVQDCNEVLVIDGGSTDNTLQIAKQYHAKIIEQPSKGQTKNFSAVRNLGLQQASYDWIFSLDSDEYASEELIQAMSQALQEEPAAYYVTRKYVLENGRIVEHASTYPNKRLYFFHKNTVQHWIKPVHERPELQSNAIVKTLSGCCLAPLGTIADYKRKNLRYLQLEIEKSKNTGWMHWLQHRVWHTTRSRIILLIRLLRIWLIPRKGARMPLQQELLRFWYGWKLIVATCPIWSASRQK